MKSFRTVVSVATAVTTLGGLVFATADLASAASDTYRDVVLSDNPQAYYEFEEEAGSITTADSSGNGFDSVFVGTRSSRNATDPNFELLPGLNIVFGEPGRVGNGVRFIDPSLEDQGGYIQTSLQLNLNASDSTIEFLMRDTDIQHGLNRDPGLIGQDRISPSSGLGFPDWVRVRDQDSDDTTENDVVYSSSFGNPDGDGYSHSGSNPIDAEGEWQHVILTQDIITKEQRWYIDGVLTRTVVAGSDVRDAGDYRDVTTNWQFGTHSGYFETLFFDGQLDEISIYDYRLDDPNGDDDMSDSRTLVHFNALPALPQTADFDQDGDVDGSDFLDWQRGFGSLYDATNLADWESQFGGSAEVVAASNAVPEPSAGILLLLATAGLLACYRQVRLLPCPAVYGPAHKKSPIGIDAECA